MNARVTHSEDDGEADFGEASELFPHDLDGGVGNTNDVISHLKSFASDARPGTGEWFVTDDERRFL